MTESLVTGLLYVGLDFFPGAPIDLVQKPDQESQVSGNRDRAQLPSRLGMHGEQNTREIGGAEFQGTDGFGRECR